MFVKPQFFAGSAACLHHSSFNSAALPLHYSLRVKLALARYVQVLKELNPLAKMSFDRLEL